MNTATFFDFTTVVKSSLVSGRVAIPERITTSKPMIMGLTGQVDYQSFSRTPVWVELPPHVVWGGHMQVLHWALSLRTKTSVPAHAQNVTVNTSIMADGPTVQGAYLWAVPTRLGQVAPSLKLVPLSQALLSSWAGTVNLDAFAGRFAAEGNAAWVRLCISDAVSKQYQIWAICDASYEDAEVDDESFIDGSVVQGLVGASLSCDVSAASDLPDEPGPASSWTQDEVPEHQTEIESWAMEQNLRVLLTQSSAGICVGTYAPELAPYAEAPIFMASDQRPAFGRVTWRAAALDGLYLTPNEDGVRARIRVLSGASYVQTCNAEVFESKLIAAFGEYANNAEDGQWVYSRELPNIIAALAFVRDAPFSRLSKLDSESALHWWYQWKGAAASLLAQTSIANLLDNHSQTLAALNAAAVSNQQAVAAIGASQQTAQQTLATVLQDLTVDQVSLQSIQSVIQQISTVVGTTQQMLSVVRELLVAVQSVTNATGTTVGVIATQTTRLDDGTTFGQYLARTDKMLEQLAFVSRSLFPTLTAVNA